MKKYTYVYVQNIYTDKEYKFNSLKKAVEYAISVKDETNLIHIGYYNLDYYKNGDTFDTLYKRCKEIIKNI